MSEFAGKAVLISGAASGIGLATAEHFAECGARVMMVDRNAAALDEQCGRLKGAGHSVAAFAADVSDYAQCEAMVAACLAEFGALDIAFNNAGVPSGMDNKFDEFSVADWDRVIGTNLSGMFYAMKAEVPALRLGGGGVIINTASVMAIIAGKGMAAYVASKHGLAGLTRAAALDLIGENIRVNAICPGFVSTGMTAKVLANPAALEAVHARIPAGRIADPAEMAKAVAYLASAAASFMVGELLTLDGGVKLSRG